MHPPVQQMLEEHGRFASASPRNAMTVDVEEYFQVAAFEGRIRRDTWDQYPSRVALNTGRVLDAFAEHGVRATFFVLGWVAERDPALVRRIVADGHELASHGYDHTRATMLDRAAFTADVTRTKKHARGSVRVRRARLPRAELLHRRAQPLGARRAARGRATSTARASIRSVTTCTACPRRRASRSGCTADGILELPVTTVEVAGRKLPAGGGGYFRLLPYPLYAWALRRVNRRDRQPGIFYFHPWEVDPEQPRIDGRVAALAVPPLRQSGHDGSAAAAPAARFPLGPHGRGISDCLTALASRRTATLGTTAAATQDTARAGVSRRRRGGLERVRASRTRRARSFIGRNGATCSRRAFGHPTHYLLAERDGAICGVLPLAEVRSRLFGHALVSTPFCVYGGIVATDRGGTRRADRARL